MVWKRRYLNIQPASHFFILCSLGLFQGRIYYQLVPMWRNVAQTDQAPPRRSVLLLKPLDLRRGVHQNETTGDGRSIQCLAPRPGPEGFMSKKPTDHATGRFTYMDGPVLFSSSYMWANIPCMDDHGWYGRGKGTNVGKSDLENIVYHFFGHCSWFYIGVKFMEIISNSFSRAILKS